MRRLILKCGLSPGDIVMLTAAVRDLHGCHPGEFATDVRTLCPALWENNPHLATLAETEAGVETIECRYPLIDVANRRPYHCLHGFIEYLNRRLDVAIKPTLFKGDIHLSALERSWYSQVHEVTGRDIPFWLVVSGGKHDLTTKWWKLERFQRVVDHFAGRIQFVQVGQWRHHHPRLEGVIDLRGQTDLRQLVRLVHHAQGVLCGVTALMHLAAAVEFKYGRGQNRPCVVVAGGREPAHWEAYPDHQFIQTNGALPCCLNGGCWKDRVAPLGDGDKRDRPASLCVDVVDGLPHCMDLISADEVIHRIELYFRGGAVDYLKPAEARAGRSAVEATSDNAFDQQPLTLQSARAACARILARIPAGPEGLAERGIVICAGGVRLFTNAWVCIDRLRKSGCGLPIQVWHLGPTELDETMKSLLVSIGVECVDALTVRRRHPVRLLGGWQLKPYAMLHSRFREVLLLDADNVAVKNPEFLFDTPQYRKTGAIFWPDFNHPSKHAHAIWRVCGMRTPAEPEFESGQIIVDKGRCREALQLTMWFNENSDFFYRHIHGDKETFHLAFRKVQKSYSLVSTPIRGLPGTMVQHDFEGRRVFQHRNTAKWSLLYNRRIPGFRFEDDCLAAIEDLKQRWDGRLNTFPGKARRSRVHRAIPTMVAVMMSCRERESVRRETLQRLAGTDWGGERVEVVVDEEGVADRSQRQTEVARRALVRGLETNGDFLLFLEDDLEFNRHLLHNLRRWKPVRTRELTLGGLYNPGIREAAFDPDRWASLVEPGRVFGSQAFLISRATARFVVQNWNRVRGHQDIRISRLAGRLKRPIWYHSPSLVQHVGKVSVWGGGFHQANDFDSDWRA